MSIHRKQKRLILVTGATGKQGGAVVRHLHDSGFAVRALTRNPDSPAARALQNQPGVEVARGELEDQASLLRALEDAYGVFAALTPSEAGVEAEVKQGMTLVEAARAADIEHFIYSSVGSAGRNTGIPHFDSKWKIEEHLRTTGVPYTILRPVYFMENWLAMKPKLASGPLMLPLGPETRLQQVAVDNIAGFAVMALEHPGKWKGAAIELAGDELSLTQTAETLGTTYQQIPWEAFEAQAGHEMTLMFRWFEDVGYNADIPELRRQYPALISFESWHNTHWADK